MRARIRCEAGGPAGMLAASIYVCPYVRERRPAGSGINPLPAEHTPVGGLCLARLSLDGLVEHELAVLDRVDPVVRERGVAVLVDRVRAEHGLAVLGREDGLDDVGLLTRLGALDRVEGEAHGLVAVDRVRIRMGLAVLLGEGLEELLA